MFVCLFYWCIHHTNYNELLQYKRHTPISGVSPDTGNSKKRLIVVQMMVFLRPRWDHPSDWMTCPASRRVLVGRGCPCPWCPSVLLTSHVVSQCPGSSWPNPVNPRSVWILLGLIGVFVILTASRPLFEDGDGWVPHGQLIRRNYDAISDCLQPRLRWEYNSCYFSI